MTELKTITKNVTLLLFAIISVLSMSMRNTLYEGFCAEHKLGNILSRFYNSFERIDYLDVIAVIALFVFFRKVFERHKKICLSAVFVSILLAISFVLALSYYNYDSTIYLYCDNFQILMSIFQVSGISILLYAILNFIDDFFCDLKEGKDELVDSKLIIFLKKHFFMISVHFIFICWLIWLLFTYPGSVNPDSITQLQHFYGDLEWTVWQPPFSTVIMGGFFQLGKSIGNAGFGMFLYNLFQGIVGALVFSYGLSRLIKRNVCFVIPVCGMLFFGLTPMWGSYVQWFEKDFLFTVFVTLFVILVSEVYFEKKCSSKMLVSLILTGIVMGLLRSNGIYVIVPTMLALCFYVKGIERKKIIASFAIVVVLYVLITKAVYPAFGIGKNSVAETMGFMLQATARYVQEYPNEVTAYEKEVLSNNFYSYDCLSYYNPRIMDPVKIYYNHSDFKSYLKIWLEMFMKHPWVYVESYLNGSYGYLAPVSREIGAYINLDNYDPYLLEHGVKHVENGNLNYLAVWIWNINLGMPFVNYTVSPGLYTWLSIIILWLLLKNRKMSGILLLIPSLVNILVCTASPLADAMRYALPTVAVIPFLIGWIFLLFFKKTRV